MNVMVAATTTEETMVMIRKKKKEKVIIIIYPLTARVVGAPQIISQPVFSIFPCSPLPSGTW